MLLKRGNCYLYLKLSLVSRNKLFEISSFILLNPGKTIIFPDVIYCPKKNNNKKNQKNKSKQKSHQIPCWNGIYVTTINDAKTVRVQVFRCLSSCKLCHGNRLVLRERVAGRHENPLVKEKHSGNIEFMSKWMRQTGTTGDMKRQSH